MRSSLPQETEVTVTVFVINQLPVAFQLVRLVGQELMEA